MSLSNKITNEIIKTYIHYPHIFGRALGFKDLISLHSEWIINAWIRDNELAMQAHRNSYKTTSILIVGAIWYLLFFDCNASILFIRKSDPDAQKIISTISKIVKESPLVTALVDKIYKAKDITSSNWSKSSITLSIKKTQSPEGSIEAKGTTSAITGTHYDKIFPDDIITLQDRVSKAEREWIKNFVRELKNIKKEGGKIYYSGTPWHKEDAWSILPTPRIYPIGTVNIPGFMPDQLSDKIADLKNGNTLSLYAANYELVHVVDIDRVFSEPLYYPWPTESKQIIAYLDPAYSGNNTTALSIGAQIDDENIVVRGYVWRQDVTELYDVIVNILNNYKCGTLYIEKNADKGLSSKQFSIKYPSVISRHESENKHIRIISLVKKNWSHIKFSDDCNSDYVNQVIDYIEGQEPDDAPDSLAGLCREMGIFGTSIETRANWV
jgi:hypothetical protein